MAPIFLGGIQEYFIPRRICRNFNTGIGLQFIWANHLNCDPSLPLTLIYINHGGKKLEKNNSTYAIYCITLDGMGWDGYEEWMRWIDGRMDGLA
jgi:hypothetical protein